MPFRYVLIPPGSTPEQLREIYLKAQPTPEEIEEERRERDEADRARHIEFLKERFSTGDVEHQRKDYEAMIRHFENGGELPSSDHKKVIYAVNGDVFAGTVQDVLKLRSQQQTVLVVYVCLPSLLVIFASNIL